MDYLSALAFVVFMIYMFVVDMYWNRTGDNMKHPHWNIVINSIISAILTWVLMSWIA